MCRWYGFPVTNGTLLTPVVGKWYRWFHPPRGQSSSPDTPTTLKTIHQILSRSDNFKWDSIPFPTPLHFQLDYVYTIDKDAGHFTVTQWKTVNGALYPRARRTTLASIRETSLSTIDTLLDDVPGVSKHNNHSLNDSNDETDVQHLLDSFGIKPSIPPRLNELQFQLFTDFIFTWRFYFDDTSNWECSLSLFTTLAIENYVSQHGTLKLGVRILRNCRSRSSPIHDGKCLLTRYSGFTNI